MPRIYSIGEPLLGGRYLITGELRYPLYRAREAARPEGPGLLALCLFGLKRPLSQIQARLSFSGPGLSPLRYLGPEEEGRRYQLLLEEEPPGAPALEQLLRARALRLALEVGEVMERRHAEGRALGLSWPEQIYIQQGRLSGIVARAAAFLAEEDTSGVMYNPPWPNTPVPYGLLSPEGCRGLPHSQATDVFALCLLLCYWLTGQNPFTPPEGGAVATLRATMQGERRPIGLPRDIEAALEGGLRTDPKERPPLSELLSSLRAL